LTVFRRPALAGHRRLTAVLAAACAIAALGLDVPARAAQAVEPALPGTFTGSYLAGRTAETDDDRDNAIRFFNQALALSTDNLTVKQQLFLTLLSTGDFDNAVPLAGDLRDEPDVDRLARLVLGARAIKEGRKQDALDALKLDAPSDLDRLIMGLLAAWAEQGAGDTDAALKRLAGLKGPDWFDPFTLAHTAYIAEIAGRNAEAQKAYEAAFTSQQALQAAPDAWLRMMESYAAFLARAKDNAKAFNVLQKGQEVAPIRPMFDVIRAQIMEGASPPAPVTNAATGAGEVLFSMAMAINRQGAEPFVERYLKIAADLSPADDLIRYELGRLSERIGRNADAVTYFSSVPQGAPLYRLAHLQHALNLTDLERNDEAKAQLRSVIAEDPGDVRAHLALGGIFMRAKDFRSAATVYDEAIEAVAVTNDNAWNLHYQRGIAYERLKEWDKAEPAFRRALELNPDDADVLNYLGYSLIDKGLKLDEALKMVEKAVELEPDSGYIIDSLGWAYFRLGRLQDAIVELERAIAILPGDATINDHLGDAYWAVGRKLEARFQWNHALKGEPEPGERLKINNKIGKALTEEAAARRAHLEAFEKAKAEADAAAERAAAAQVPAPEGTAAAGIAALASSAPAIAAAQRSHVVARGESLWSIARDQLGDAERFRDILSLNPALNADPSSLEIGDTLLLPQ
jgi:tetratricopeptide (TPR) repeat protein